MLPPDPSSLAGQLMRRTLRSTVRMHPILAQRVFGPPPRNDRGAPLDTQLHILLTTMEKTNSPRLERLGEHQARVTYRRASQLFDYSPSPNGLNKKLHFTGPATTLSLEIYRPKNSPTSNPQPACIFYHGGGFVIGCIKSYAGFCQAFADRSRCTIISAEYRLAPEHPFPAAVDDSVAIFNWVRANAASLNIDPTRLAVAGDSAGGNLATVVCQQLAMRDAPLPLHQLLIYPKTDNTRRYPSRDLFAEGYYLTGPAVDWFTECYLVDAENEDPRISPLRFDDLAALPPATLVTAGFDPLRDEGEAYGEGLRDAGVLAKEHRFDHLVHGFISMGGIIDAAHHAISDIATDFGRAMSCT